MARFFKFHQLIGELACNNVWIAKYINVMVSHVHKARYRLADLVSLVVELLSTAPHKRNFGSSNGLKIELKTQELYALLAKG